MDGRGWRGTRAADVGGLVQKTLEFSISPDMEEQHFDVVVIGAGPGGEGAAMQAVKHGKSVAVVDRMARVGGACTHSGTIPSKALRFAIFQMTEANNNRLFRDAGVSINLTIPQLRKSAKSVIEQQVDVRRTFYDRN